MPNDVGFQIVMEIRCVMQGGKHWKNWGKLRKIGPSKYFFSFFFFFFENFFILRIILGYGNDIFFTRRNIEITLLKVYFRI